MKGERRLPGKLPVCTRCKYYHVTWDPARPHGCKAFGFKSRTNPALEVFRSSGVRCGYYEEKKRS